MASNFSYVDAANALNSSPILHSKKHNQVLKTVVTVATVAVVGAGITPIHASIEVAKHTSYVTRAFPGFVPRTLSLSDCFFSRHLKITLMRVSFCCRHYLLPRQTTISSPMKLSNQQWCWLAILAAYFLNSKFKFFEFYIQGGPAFLGYYFYL
ncbi:uncharacterized protein G2W53_002934 [Senna tora]|uniref:Uncharacterized protein n=1 Tax=Senna tora TaxID=362788 RepID=A0A834X8Y2_9FABA|nr:uncharacterized protein G2W53_002934 [Senna tora]